MNKRILTYIALCFCFLMLFSSCTGESVTAEAGVTLTAVGATFPYGVDPDDSNLRLAPTYPADVELSIACEILVLSIKLAALEKLGI